MVHTIGLYNHNGRVGSALLQALIPLHNQGEIKVIVLHRDGSNTTAIPEGIELRKVNINGDQADKEVNKKAVEGINVLISSAAAPDILNQKHIIDALSTSSDIYTFIPSEFGTNWTPADIIDPNLSFLLAKEEVRNYAKEKDVPVTKITTGGFIPLILGMAMFGIDIKGNGLKFFADAASRPMELVTLPYLAKGTIQLSLRPAQTIANRTININEYTPTGSELGQILSIIHGTSTTIGTISPEENDESLKSGVYGAIASRYRAKWGKEGWNLDGVEELEVEGWEKEGLEGIIRGMVGL